MHPSLKKLCVLFVLVAMMANVLAGYPGQVSAAEGDRLLRLEEAYQMALKTSESIREAQTEVQKNETELKQAGQAVQNEQLKDLSLFAKPHSLPKDLDIRTKVPNARAKLDQAKRALAQKELELLQKVQTSYYQIYQLEKLKESADEQARKQAGKLREWEVKQRYQLAKQEQVDEARAASDKATSAYKQAALTHKSAMIEFGSMIGVNMEKESFTFEVRDQYAQLNQNTAMRLLDHALKNDVTLVNATEKRKAAEAKVKLIRELYKNKFGSGHVSGIEAVYASGDVNPKLLTVNNDMLLKKAKQDWEPWIPVPIPILWIVIPLPKSLFQGEFDGLRYFEDQRQALPIAQMELEQAIALENETRKAVADKVKTSYLAAKGAEEVYAQALAAEDKAKKDRSGVEAKVRVGLAEQAALDQADTAIVQAEQTKNGTYMQYLTTLAALNVAVTGGLEPFMREAILPWRSIDDGLSPLNQSQPEPPASPISGTWEIVPVMEGMLGQLKVQLKGPLAAESYTVHYAANGARIGVQTKLGETVSHLQLLFAEPGALQIQLHGKDGTLAKAKLEGNGASGVLAVDVLEKPEASPMGADQDLRGYVIIGSYQIHLKALSEGNLKAARATVPASGQGTFYQSEFAGGTWFKLDEASEALHIMDAKSKAVAAPDEIAALKLLVDILADGTIKPMVTPSEIAEKLVALADKKEKLEEDNETAMNEGETAELAGLVIELKQTEAEIALYEALQQGDQAKAEAAMALVGDPGALMEAMVAEAEALEQAAAQEALAQAKQELAAAEQAGDAERVAELEAEVAAQEAALAEAAADAIDPAEAAAAEAAEQSAAYEAALQSGDAEQAEALLAGLVAAQAEEAAAAQGLAEQAAGAAEALALLEDMREQALASGETQEAEELAEAIVGQNALIVVLEQEKLMLELAALEAVSEEAEPEMMAAMEQLKTELILALQALEAELYTADELAELGVIAQAAASDLPGAAMLPASHVISSGFNLHLTVSPVVYKQRAYAPTRDLAESLGATVIWDEAAQTVTISGDQLVLIFTINSDIALLNGQEVLLDAPARIVNGYTITPVRLVAEQLGAEVEWHPSTQSVLIAKPAS